MPPFAKIGFGDFAEFEIFEIFEPPTKNLSAVAAASCLARSKRASPQSVVASRDRKSANHEPLKNRPPLKKPCWRRDGQFQPISECRSIQRPAHAAEVRWSSPSVVNVSVIRFSSLPYIVTVTKPSPIRHGSTSKTTSGSRLRGSRHQRPYGIRRSPGWPHPHSHSQSRVDLFCRLDNGSRGD